MESPIDLIPGHSTKIFNSVRDKVKDIIHTSSYAPK